MIILNTGAISACHPFAKQFGFRGPRVASCVHLNQRVRGVGSKLYFRPTTETFSEFKYHHLKQVLGRDWWIHQARQSRSEMHPIMQCAVDYHQVAAQHLPANHLEGQVFAAPATNSTFELLHLSDDVLRLIGCGAGIPCEVLDRLRKKVSFQGARFELLTAGLLLRSGFEIEWLNRELKQGEFRARDPDTGDVFCVEVKSRHRHGVLCQPGERPHESALTADLDNLLNAALRQCSATNANAVFLDANMPMTEEAPNGWRFWDTLEEFMRRIPTRMAQADRPNAFFVCVIANGWHWRPLERLEHPPTYHVFLSPCNAAPSHIDTFIRLIAATAYPPKWPEGIYE